MTSKTPWAICAFALALLSTSTVFSQILISGTVNDQSNTALSYANVLLLNAADSSLVKGELTDDMGLFKIEVQDQLAYIVNVSYLGYENYYSERFTPNPKQEIKFNDIVLYEGLALEEVNIIAKKPLYEQKIDRMVVNVANTLTYAGGTAIEILERSPGVIVNRQSGSLSMLGKDGVVIMINGKLTYQPAESIIQMLEGMSADNIESIELITTPPSNFDAEGNAGYINIVLKQRTDLGLNGQINSSIAYGEGKRGSLNTNFNYRKDKINFFGNYSFVYREMYQEFYNSREVNYNSINTFSEVTTERDPLRTIHNGRFGIDYAFSDNTIIGILTSGYENTWEMDAFNYGFTRVNDVLDSSLDLTTNETNRGTHFMVNANLEHKFSSRHHIKLDYDILRYRIDNPTDYLVNYYDKNDNLIETENSQSTKDTPIRIKVAQLDYDYKHNEKLTFMLGGKLSLSEFENDIAVQIKQNDIWEDIYEFTNDSDWGENIYAAYSSLDFNLDENNAFKFGLRYEFTDSKLNTVKEGLVVDREFGRLFPSAFYSRTLDENQSINLSYNQRITRPTFGDMAPFAIFLDPSTYFFGNAELQAAISNNYKLDYRFKSYLLSFQYAVEDSTIAKFQDKIILESNQQAWEPVNLSDTKLFSTLVSIPVYIGNNWTMQNNFIYLWSQVNSFYEGTYVQGEKSAYTINTTQSFQFPHNISAELSGFYNSAAQDGRAEYEPIYGINFGLQKKLSNGDRLSFNIRDVFDSVTYSGGTDIPELGFKTYADFDFSNRVFTLSYSTRFGNDKVKSARKRQTGSEAERNRVN